MFFKIPIFMKRFFTNFTFLKFNFNISNSNQISNSNSIVFFQFLIKTVFEFKEYFNLKKMTFQEYFLSDICRTFLGFLNKFLGFPKGKFKNSKFKNMISLPFSLILNFISPNLFVLNVKKVMILYTFSFKW